MSQTAYDDHDEVLPPHRQAQARFPMSALLIVALGLLLFLLVLSGGFNVWFIANPDVRFNHRDEARRQAEMAAQQQAQAAQANQRAIAMQQEFQLKQAVLQGKIDELTRQLDAAKEQLEEAKRGKAEK